MQEPLIERRRNRDQVASVLRDLIASGEIDPGAKLDEARLSERLGVSRTPIREAMIGLEHEGWIRSVPNKGARAVAADERLVREVYPILGALEAEALRSSGRHLIDSADRLLQLNARLREEHQRAEQHTLDSAFHRALVEYCGNTRLLSLIETHWALARRFDGAYERGTANHLGSCEQHQHIAEAVQSGELNLAADLVRAHWDQGIDVVCEWLRSRA